MYRTFAMAMFSSLAIGPGAAIAADTFAISGDAGASARYIDNITIRDPDGYGLTFGLRTEVNLLFHFQADLRYVDGRLFSQAEHRFVDASFSASSPALLVFALDVHELMVRSTNRPGDDQFYVATGLAVKGRVLKNSLKASLGFAYLSADGIAPARNERAMGAYVGAEHRLRTSVVDTNLRGAWFITMNRGEPHMGLLTDGDLTVKFPVGGAYIGPRLDLSYRNLGIDGSSPPLFGQQHEFNASVAFAVGWGGASDK